LSDAATDSPPGTAAPSPSPADEAALKDRLVTSISNAYCWLFSAADPAGHWNEVRSTALAGIALCRREAGGCPWLDAIRDWLLSKQVGMGADRGSWGEELWDTSMAMLALLELRVLPSDPAIQRALWWQKDLFGANDHHNWHDEPWETSWSLLAGLKVRQRGGGEPQWDTVKALDWLQGLQDAEGRIVAPHYTAYFVSICAELPEHLRGEGRFDAAERAAAGYLNRTWRDSVLWSGEAWSNGQILWILASAGRLDLGDDRAARLTGWFTSHQAADGSWGRDVEDTASAILGLYALLLLLEVRTAPSRSAAEDLIYNRLRRCLDTPIYRPRLDWIDRHQDGSTSIHVTLTPRRKRGLKIGFAVVSGVSLLITFWEQIRSMVGGLFAQSP
jgi:hypothetical protein